MFKELRTNPAPTYDARVKINLSQLVEVKNKIQQADKILLITHRNPDGDAIGSVTAMMGYLNQLNKYYIAWCIDGVPDNLEYLSQSYDISNNQNQLIENNFDLIIVVDCGSIDHSGAGDILRGMQDDGINLINIDHHSSNYGDINIVDTQASATAVILYEIFKLWKVKIDKAMATSLLAGILVDTGSFSNSGTTTMALDIAAELINLGARFGEVSNNIYKSKNNSGLKFWTKVLSRLQKNDKLKVVYSVILREDTIGVSSNELDGVANFFNYLEEAKISMVLKEIENNKIKVSLRSMSDNISVAQIAKFFGGGGHVKAAGFVINGRLEEEKDGWRIV